MTRDASKRSGHLAARPAQTQAKKQPHHPNQKSHTTRTQTRRRVERGPGGQPVQVVAETEEHVVKKTVWTRVLTGATKAAAPTWKKTGKAVKSVVPHSNKSGKDSMGFNLSYYRKTFFLLDKQAQFDLYQAGLAPKLTAWEASKFKNSSRRVCRKYKKQAVMYAAHQSPDGYAAPPMDLVVEAKAAKLRARAFAEAKKKEKMEKKKKKQQKKGKEAAVNQNNDDDSDALPAHPTPAHFTKMHKVQIKIRPSSTSTAGVQRHRQQQLQLQQHQHHPQAQPHRLHPQAPTLRPNNDRVNQSHGQGQRQAVPA
ncbi:hypothetical protein C7999DRAFT_14872 [Corynascus novoguineensis]|uniref:Uncharacterized protein n=1 Tax=Corynascus novoguineensis TaxID=1126955 RepID=A0AAN7CRN8_9PEZI|nr:hypothetical protein C7999DRAFT_14872 [Corynascus novoguineensis]